MTKPTTQRRTLALAVAALAYVALALIVDVLISRGASWPFAWGALRWRLSSGADLTKFIIWFVIPFAFCLPWMDWGYFSPKRWRRIDLAIFAGMAVIGMIAVLCVRLSPSLSATFGGYADASATVKWRFVCRSTMWTFSWLIGWEFMHRYLLLTRLQAAWPRFAWLVIPLFEGAYHLTWDSYLMPIGMVAFSLIVTYWARKRQNVLLPFLAHLVIELELIGFRLLI